MEKNLKSKIDTIKTKNGILIHRIGFYYCSYLIQSGQRNILVDTGPKWKFKWRLKEIETLLSGGTIDDLILTHIHYDHCANTFKIKKKYGCNVYAHAAEEMYLAYGRSPLPPGTKKAANFLSQRASKLIPWAFYFKGISDSLDVLDYKVKGSDIQIIHCPGHTNGSISVVIDHEVAIIGDTAFGHRYKEVFPVFADEPEMVIRTWQKLLKIPIKLFLPGHGIPIIRKRIEDELSNNPFIQASDL